MRYIVAALIAALTFIPSSHAQDRSIYVHSWGTNSCGQYLAAVHGHAPGTGFALNHPQRGQLSDQHLLYTAWLGGFLTTMNWLVLDKPNNIENDPAAIDVWIRKWCEQNPTKPLFEAASAFVVDQRKEYLQAWFARQAR
jgi:hypothetical protein